MMATLLSLAGYLLYAVCMVALSFTVLGILINSPSFKNLPMFIQFCIALIPAFVLDHFWWVVPISESNYTLPSIVSQLLLCLACYLVCMMVWPVVFGIVFTTCSLVWSVALGQHQLPERVFVIVVGITFVVTNSVTNYFVDHARIFEFLTHTTAQLVFIAAYLAYTMCMAALSCLMLALAFAAIENTKTWWPELIHTSIVGLALLLLNMMWGSPFQKPSADPDTRAALTGYLLYVVSSMALSYNLFGASLLLRTLVVSLTFALVGVFVKPSTVPDMIAALGTIATALLAFFFLVAMSFVVFVFLQTWVEMLLPSACIDHPAGTFATILGLAFVATKAMLDVIILPAVEGPSVFSDMKAGLIGIAGTINAYHGAYVGIRNLTVLAVPVLSMESRRRVSTYRLYTKAALVVALGLVLTMPPGPGTPTTEMPAFTLVSNDFVQQTITNFATKGIQAMDGGEIKQLDH